MNKNNNSILQDIDYLNQSFGNANVKFLQVTPELYKAELRFSKNARAEIHLQGAHLTRWTDTLGRENIFNSSSAVYQEGVPIRGGNPIIFPQFGAGDISQHGFARNSRWRVMKTQVNSRVTTLGLELRPEDLAPHYRQQWPHDFVLSVTISLGETLVTQMQVRNPSRDSLVFTQGFHTYLAVDDIHSVEISDFSGLEYMDNLRDHAIFQETREKVEISEFIDRRYQGIADEIKILDKSTGRLFLMHTKKCRDAFVWNPWEEAEKKLADLTPQSYQKFICVEPGNMKTPIVLRGGQVFVSEQEIKRVD
jgi:glucose-6-phosphate 1-epimerase